MIYFVTALDAEARPLIDHYRLKRDTTLPYTLYRDEEILLLVTGIGKTNALMAVSAVLGYSLPCTGDILLNIGICGAPKEYEVGEALMVHKIIDNDRSYYPDMLYTHALRETSLQCVDKPQESAHELPVDMESAAVFQAASRFLKLHQMGFLKIVSDHFEPEYVTKEGVQELVRSHLPTIDELRQKLHSVGSVSPLFTPEESIQITRFKTLFTKSQGDVLNDALCYFRLTSPHKPLPIEYESHPSSKRERSRLHERTLAALYA